jgi:KDO2-lipid IV(A) lauroyltransferase
MAPQAHDVRLGEAWTPLQRLKNDLVWTLSRAALSAVRRLPPRWLERLGCSIGLAAYAFAGTPRRIALANIEGVLCDWPPNARRALARRCFATLGRALGETVAVLGDASSLSPLPLTPAAAALFADAAESGRGVVLASAHLGPWERVAASLVAAGVPLVALARESYDPRFSSVYERLRRAAGVRFIWRGAPHATTQILRALKRRDVLGIPMDLRSRVPSVSVPFLGRDAPTAIGPARIALRTRALVVVATVAPASAAGLAVSATRISAEDLRPDAQGVRALTARINEELSKRILALPDAWPWMHRRWDTITEV